MELPTHSMPKKRYFGTLILRSSLEIPFYNTVVEVFLFMLIAKSWLFHKAMLKVLSYGQGGGHEWTQSIGLTLLYNSAKIVIFQRTLAL
jgi:hypothetical protein